MQQSVQLFSFMCPLLVATPYILGL